MFPLEFQGEVNRQETRVTGLSYSEDPMIVVQKIVVYIHVNGTTV